VTVPDFAAIATDYALLGCPVFPVVPLGKVPVIPNAHPKGDPLRTTCHARCGRDGHGLWDATLDLERIARWWHRWPRANVGIRTGEAFDALDLDGELGIDSFDAWCVEHEVNIDYEVVPVVTTPSGGLHYYWRPIGHGNRTKMIPGVDWRGTGGYVVAAESVREDGAYRWLTEYSDPVDPPPPLVDLVCATEAPLPPAARPCAPPGPGEARNGYVVAVLRNACDDIARARHPGPGVAGERHDTLCRMAMRVMGYVKGGELDGGLAVQWLTNAALSVGLGDAEITDAIASAKAKATVRNAPPPKPRGP